MDTDTVLGDELCQEIFPTSAVQPSVGVFSPQDMDLIKYMLKLEGKDSGSQT